MLTLKADLLGNEADVSLYASFFGHLLAANY